MCGPLPPPLLADLVTPGPPARLLRGGQSVCDVLPLGPAGLPHRRGMLCCFITAASTRSMTSSPWRLWTSRCSSPSRQVGPPRGKGSVLSAVMGYPLGGLKPPYSVQHFQACLPVMPWLHMQESILWQDSRLQKDVRRSAIYNAENTEDTAQISEMGELLKCGTFIQAVKRTFSRRGPLTSVSLWILPSPQARPQRQWRRTFPGA